MIAEKAPSFNGLWTPARIDSASADQRLGCLLDVAHIVNSSLDVGVVIDRILDHAVRILSAESGSIMLVEDDPASRLRVLAARGPRAEHVLGKEQEMGQGIAGWVASAGEPILLHGSAPDDRFRRICTRADVRDALSVPLKTGKNILGVINLSNRRSDSPFVEDDLALLTALADQAAVAIRNARAYQELRRQHRTLERVLEEITRAQEEERMRIALQMQEGPGMVLANALARLREIRPTLSRDPSAAETLAVDMEQALNQAMRETRMLMLDLQPPRLEGLGLHAALRQYAGQFESQTGIRTRYESRGEQVRLSETVESCLYRIAQEALTNVWKHTHAGQVWMTLEAGARSCMLEVRDDGHALPRNDYGVIDERHPCFLPLRERADMVGGKLMVQCVPNQGTTVRVVAPLAA